MTKANNFQRIRELNYLQKAVLASALIERMLPNYGLFSEATGFGDEALLRSALNVCWEKILLPKSKIDLEKQVEKIVEIELSSEERVNFEKSVGSVLTSDETKALAYVRIKNKSDILSTKNSENVVINRDPISSR